MGCYDTVRLFCPSCGTPYYAQSKGGSCTLAGYELYDCPQDVLSDVNRHAPFRCSTCGKYYRVILFPVVQLTENL